LKESSYILAIHAGTCCGNLMGSKLLFPKPGKKIWIKILAKNQKEKRKKKKENPCCFIGKKCAFPPRVNFI
jgi:hypothetical protein